MTYKNDIERIYYEWDAALANNDVDTLMSLYVTTAVLESPLVPHLMRTESGVCRGENDLRVFFEILSRRKPTLRKYYRSGYFTDGKRLIWEYPRLTPESSEQMDFIEVMEIEKGLIHYHRVYWGWRGFDVMSKDQYHRE